MALVSLANVHKHYGSHHVIRGISMDVDRHEVACLIGGSGSGKSTLLRCINGLETIEDGTITFDGEVITDPGVDLDAVRRRLGIVFQSYNLFPQMSVAENVMLAPRHVLRMGKGEARRRLSRPAFRRPAAACGDRARIGDESQASAA